MMLENISWELRKLLAFPIPEVIVTLLVFNFTVALQPVEAVFNTPISSYNSIRLHTILFSTIFTFSFNFFFGRGAILPSSTLMMEGIITGILSTMLFTYEREIKTIDVDLVYSRGRKEIYISKTIALTFFVTFLLYISGLIVIVYVTKFSYVLEVFVLSLTLFVGILVQEIFVVSICLLLSIISERSIISLIANIFTFYSLDMLLGILSRNSFISGLLAYIPPNSAISIFYMPEFLGWYIQNDLIKLPIVLLQQPFLITIYISLIGLGISYFYFTRFYEV